MWNEILLSSKWCWDRGVVRALVGLVADEGDDHAVQVEEEHQQVETQLDERFLARVSSGHCRWKPEDARDSYLLMDVQLPEDFCRVEQVVLLENPMSLSAGQVPPKPIASGIPRTSFRSMPRGAG